MKGRAARVHQAVAGAAAGAWGAGTGADAAAARAAAASRLRWHLSQEAQEENTRAPARVSAAVKERKVDDCMAASVWNGIIEFKW